MQLTCRKAAGRLAVGRRCCLIHVVKRIVSLGDTVGVKSVIKSQVQQLTTQVMENRMVWSSKVGRTENTVCWRVRCGTEKITRIRVLLKI